MPRDRDKFKSREWSATKVEEFGRQVERVHPATETGRAGPKWREATLNSVVGCDHTQRHFIETENDYGIWGCEICVDCGQQVAGPECPHVRCTWHLDGKILVCDNCGMDCT